MHYWSHCQVDFIGSSDVGSQLRGFELRQLSSNGGTQSPYVVEVFDEMAITGKFVTVLSPSVLKNA